MFVLNVALERGKLIGYIKFDVRPLDIYRPQTFPPIVEKFGINNNSSTKVCTSLMYIPHFAEDMEAKMPQKKLQLVWDSDTNSFT